MVNIARWSAVAAISLAATGLVVTGAPASAASHHSTPKLVQQGHVTFWECPAKTTGVLIGVNKVVLRPGDTLTVNFIVRNEGATACNFVAPYAGVAPGPTATTLQAGPCGSMGFQIQGAHHRNVWPGTQPFNCPALGFAQLQPNSTVSGAGTWTQVLPGGTKRVAPGSYTLVVSGRFSFPLQIKKR
jgi:hypothetical protein